MESINRLFAINNYLPHGYCISWSTPLLSAFVVSDALIFLSYFSMPAALLYFALRRPDFPYRWMLWMFSAFMMACGATHLIDVVVLWQPIYGLLALFKAGTALISIVTAIMLWPLLFRALELPSPTQLRLANEKLEHEIVERQRVQKALHLLSDCNAVLVHVDDEQTMLSDICRLTVEIGGYHMAWVGFVQHDPEKSVLCVAQSSQDAYLRVAPITWADQERGQGPTGLAIRTGTTQICQDCLSNPQMAPWRAELLKHGYQSIAALPLVIENKVLGVLRLCSTQAQAFGATEIRLLEELASNMAYGITSLRLRCELERHRQNLEVLVEERTHQIATLNTELVAKVNEAESANRAKSAFLATMSHEIRTPLNAVIGLAGLLSGSPLERGQRDYADKIALSAQALRILIDDILDFSKIEAGALQLEQAPFSLNTILATTAAVLSVCLGDKPIEALFNIEPGIPDALIGDAMRLQQILLNLTSNAIKFTKQGEVVVTVHCLARDEESATLEFLVRDTGIGIPAEQMERIFEVFAQADMSTSRQYGGTGLGLAISARLANLMGSRIEVDTDMGRGSTFHFSVTLAVAQRPLAGVPEEKLSDLRILIVDDHPLSRHILRRACAAFGYLASACDSGAAGLGELRRGAADGKPYDILLLDWHMPGMDGIEMLRKAYGTDTGLPLVILMVATVELERAAVAGEDLLLDGILAKPVTPASLLAAIKLAQIGQFSTILPPDNRNDRRLKGLRLLIAEDNAINQQVIEQILCRAGAEVVIVSSGLDAIDALEMPGARFDALLTDIQMPGMDGYSTTRIIREEMCLLDLPIIAVTAYAMPEDRERSRRAGMVGHIVKPIDVGDLLDILPQKRQAAREHPAQPSSQQATAGIDLPGVDVEAALAVFGADREKYVTLLRQLVTGHANDIDAARRLFEAADTKGAAKLIHDLRGMASFLYARKLADLGAQIAGALREGHAETVLPLFDEFQAAMRTLGEAIARLDITEAID